MNIVFLSDDFPPKSFGGAGIVAFEQARELVRIGHKVVVITTTQDMNDVSQVVFEGMVVHRLYANYHERFRAYRSLYNPQTIPGVRKILREVRPDIVHAHNIHYFLSYYVLVLARQYSKGVVLTVHDMMLIHYGKLFPRVVVSAEVGAQFDYHVSPWQQLRKYRFRFNPLRNFVIRRYLKNVDTMLAVSKAMIEALRQNGIECAKVLYNGTDIDRFTITPEGVDSFKKKYSLGDKKIMFFGGRISAAKGGDSVLGAFAMVHDVIPEATLLIAGTEDAYTCQLKERARVEGLGNNVIFTGWLSREQMPFAYAASDVVLMPSICFDSFGMVNLEAMAAKKPVIGTCFGGTTEIVVDGVTGYIVNPLHPEEIAEKVVDLFKDPQKAERFGQAGYERVKKNFNLQDRMEECLSVYQDILGQKE